MWATKAAVEDVGWVLEEGSYELRDVSVVQSVIEGGERRGPGSSTLFSPTVTGEVPSGSQDRKNGTSLSKGDEIGEELPPSSGPKGIALREDEDDKRSSVTGRDSATKNTHS